MSDIEVDTNTVEEQTEVDAAKPQLLEKYIEAAVADGRTEEEAIQLVREVLEEVERRQEEGTEVEEESSLEDSEPEPVKPKKKRVNKKYVNRRLVNRKKKF